MSEQDPEIADYYQMLVEEGADQSPSTLRKKVVWNSKNSRMAQKVFGWNKDENYRPTAWSGRVEGYGKVFL